MPKNNDIEKSPIETALEYAGVAVAAAGVATALYDPKNGLKTIAYGAFLFGISQTSRFINWIDSPNSVFSDSSTDKASQEQEHKRQ